MWGSVDAKGRGAYGGLACDVTLRFNSGDAEFTQGLVPITSAGSTPE